MKQYYVVLTPFFPSNDNFRGPFIYDQVISLQKLSGLSVIVIKINTSNEYNDYYFGDIKVHQVSVIELPTNLLPGIFIRYNANKILNKLRHLSSGNLSNIKIIHGHTTNSSGLIASFLSRKISCLSIVQHHGLDILGYNNGRYLPGIIRKLNKIWINKCKLKYINSADWNVGVSNLTLEKLNEIPGYRKTKEYVLYNGVDGNKFYKLPHKKDHNIFNIGCVGNFTPTKDQMTLIKAVERIVRNKNVHDVHVHFVGTGEMLIDCKEYVTKNELLEYFTFTDTIDHSALNKYYNKLDLFVLPSYWEALGCVYLEAYNCGVSFIGIKGQGIDETITSEDKDYFLINRGDYNKLSELILYHKRNSKSQTLTINTNIDDHIEKFLKTVT